MTTDIAFAFDAANAGADDATTLADRGAHTLTATGEDIPALVNMTVGLSWGGGGQARTLPLDEAFAFILLAATGVEDCDDVHITRDLPLDSTATRFFAESLQLVGGTGAGGDSAGALAPTAEKMGWRAFARAAHGRVAQADDDTQDKFRLTTADFQPRAPIGRLGDGVAWS